MEINEYDLCKCFILGTASLGILYTGHYTVRWCASHSYNNYITVYNTTDSSSGRVYHSSR